MSDEFLPCPFCGCAAQISVFPHAYLVSCVKCQVGHTLRDTREEAAAAWNRRADIDQAARKDDLEP